MVLLELSCASRKADTTAKWAYVSWWYRWWHGVSVGVGWSILMCVCAVKKDATISWRYYRSEDSERIPNQSCVVSWSGFAAHHAKPSSLPSLRITAGSLVVCCLVRLWDCYDMMLSHHATSNPTNAIALDRYLMLALSSLP